jgi:hypothetical protein
MAAGNPNDAAVCIYCLTTSNETRFNREHIIPESVAGTLFVDDLVCERCNSTMGSQVDFELLKVPEILNAMDTLGIPYDRKGVLRSYYDTHLVSEENRLKAMPTDRGFKLLTQDLPDGSRVTPGHELDVSTLTKMLSRDQRLRDAGITEEEIATGLRELQEAYAKAAIGEEVSADDLPLTVKKLSENLHVEATPKSPAAVNRAIAKIAFEWVFSCLGRRFIEGAEWITDLRNLVCGCDKPSNLQVFRSKPIDQEIRAAHSIYFNIQPSFTTIVVNLFGGIEYTIIAPTMDASVLDDFKEQTGISDSTGIAIRLDLTEKEKHFFALRDNGSSKHLGRL